MDLSNNITNQSYPSTSKDSSLESNTTAYWDRILSILKKNLTLKEYEDWIQPLSLIEINSKQIIIHVPNMVFYHSLLSNYSQQLEKAKDQSGATHLELSFTTQNKEYHLKQNTNLKKEPVSIKKTKSPQLSLSTLFGDDGSLDDSLEFNTDYNVENKNNVTVTKDIISNTNINMNTNTNSSDDSEDILEENSSIPDKEFSSSSSLDSMYVLQNNSGLNQNYTFDSFVKGESNSFAHASCINVANSPGTAYNPLFIYGSTGLGKTHLLHAVGNQIIKKNPSLKIMYISSERFVNELVSCLRRNNMSEFRKKYRNCDVLLMDDIQFISGKNRTQEEFFHTFNALYERHKQIVVTSDMYPHSIPDIEERLRNRFQWGLIADIRQPSLEHRLEILKKKASILQIEAPEDVLHYIAVQAKKNVRELEGALHRLAAFSGLQGKPISMDLAVEIFKDTIQEKKTATLTVELIQKYVAEHFNVRVLDLKSQKRIKTLTVPRQIAFYLCRKKLNLSFPEIGSKFGGKDHSTVMYAYKKIEKDIQSDFNLRSKVDLIERSLEQFE